MQKYNILVGQSGGPTAVINCSLYGVIKESLDSDVIDKVYGMKNGIEGFLENFSRILTSLSCLSRLRRHFWDHAATSSLR